MKVLVTGGAGFIGSHTVDALLSRGHDVRILDSLEPPVHPRREKPVYVPAGIEFIRGDVRSRQDMQNALRGVHAVFHLAAHQGYLTDFSTFAGVNDAGTALLYEIIVNERLPVQKVIIASSQAVYGEGKYLCPDHDLRYPLPRTREQLQKGEWDIRCPVCRRAMRPLPTCEDRVNPHNQYAVSKYAQELYALTLGRRYGIPTVALRYSITQGPRQSIYNAYSGILRILTAKLLTGQPLTLYEDGSQLRDYVHIDDVVAANLLVLESPEADYEVFNVGGKEAVMVREFARLLAAVNGKTQPVEHPGIFRFGDVRHIISDINKLQRLGWEPRKKITENIADYINWVSVQREVDDCYHEAERVMREQGVLQKVS